MFLKMVSNIDRLNLCKALLEVCFGAEFSARQTLRGPDPANQIKKGRDIVIMKTIMKTKQKLSIKTLVATMLIIAGVKATAQLPPDFPTVTVTTYVTNSVSGGDIFLNAGRYVMILTNDGTPVWYQQLPMTGMDVKLLPNGLLHYASLFQFTATAATEVTHKILDANYNLLETITAGNGYVAEGHDFQMLPNGNALVLSYYETPMNLSTYVPGGWPVTTVSGALIQELDTQRNVIWQWRAWDHYPFNPARLLSSPLNPASIAFHVNTIFMDTDGNIILSNFPLDVEKINRQTGNVMWILGGPFGQFRFLNEDPAVAAAHFASHDINRLPNGDLLFFCDGDLAGTRSSSVYEYQIDEVAKTARLVWSNTPVPPAYSWNSGSAERMPNGNTVIGWGSGGAVPGIATPPTIHTVPAITEVQPSGQVVYQAWFNNTNYNSYRSFRFPYPVSSQATSVAFQQIILGNTYDFGATGLRLTVNSGGGVGYNSMTITRVPYAPIYPVFNDQPPMVLPVRLSVTVNTISSVGADLEFDIATLGISNPTNTTVYYRSTTGQGIFSPQPTTYNPATGKLDASINMAAQGNDMGEFCFGTPDVTQVPFPPILDAVQNYPGVQPYEVVAPPAAVTGVVYSVNQQLPVWLSWSPKGFAQYYELQIDTDPGFANPPIEVPFQTAAFYVLSNPAPATLYYYRVRTTNVGGTGDWSTGSFQTTAPFLQVTAPNGGEGWQRGLSYFVQWNYNLAESVRIDLYKGGSFLRNITTNAPFKGAFKWAIPPNLTPGSDYTIQITSVTNSAMTSASAQPFSIVDPPTFNPGSVVMLPNGSVQFGLTAPGAATATVMVSTNLTTWQVLQSVPVVNGSAVVTDNTATNSTARFYRLSLP